MRIAFLTLGDERVASSRIRAWRFGQELERQGHEVVVRPCTDTPGVLGTLLNRWDVCVIQKWTPPLSFVAMMRRRCGQLLYDCDDALLLPASDQPKGDPETIERNRARLERLLRTGLLDRVTVSTEKLADDFARFIDKNQIMTFQGPAPEARDGNEALERTRNVMWLGGPATEKYLHTVVERMTRDSNQSALSQILPILAIGATSSTNGVQAVPWDLPGQRSALDSTKIGLFPQPKGAWESRKSGYKLLEYIANSVVPVAQDNQAARSILGDSYPYLVKDEKDWSSTIGSALENVSDPEEHGRLCQYMRDTVGTFSYQTTTQKWVNFVTSVGASDGK